MRVSFDSTAMPPNVVCIVADSLRKDHVGHYGADRVATPNIDALAEDGVAFTNALPEALPTVPIRTSLFTGRRTLPYRGWQPLEEEDVTVPELLRQHGYVTALVTDTHHFAKPAMNFHRGFDTWRWVRGQEADPYRSAPAAVDLEPYTKPAMEGSFSESLLEQYLRNTHDRDDADESQFFAARVAGEAGAWLERNRDNDSFFLWVDFFDPHEPWDPPASYRGRHTDPDYEGPDLVHPKYGSVDWMTDKELDHVRGRYAEEVEFVDAQIGRVLDRLRGLGLYDETLVVFLADHGHPHGDHGSTMKTADNLYAELVDIPLVVKPPVSVDAAVDTVEAPVRTDDVPVTVLDALGLSGEADTMTGESLLPFVHGERIDGREAVVTGYHGGGHRVVRDGRWSLLVRPDSADELYDRDRDPGETTDQIGDRPEVADRLRAHVTRSLTDDDEVESIQVRHEIDGTSVD